MRGQNILSAYCFLAALTENNNDLYNHVYVPICKRALSEYSKKGRDYGSHLDIKELIFEIYGLKVPESIVCKLIRGVEASMSRKLKEELKFSVLENGKSFQINKWLFSDLDEKYKKSNREANSIEEAFNEFIKSRKINEEEIPSFTDFLNRYKTKLSSFFVGEASLIERSEEEMYYYHVDFLEYIQRSSHTFYSIAQNLYLGAIVAGFLESGLEFKGEIGSNETFFIDTPVVLRALDLQNQNETNPVLELLDLIKNTGGKVQVLSITVDEIKRVIDSAIDLYTNKKPVTTIGEACQRRNKDKAWLMTFNTNLAKNIEEILKITIEPIDQEFIKSNEKSPDIAELKELRRCKGNAAHDVYSYLYVRSLRQTTVSSINDAKVWFITTNPSLLEFNVKKKITNSVPEIVLPDVLTSLLWLKDPLKLVNTVKSIGLKELMASTLLEEVASKELINEYDNQIKKIDGIDEESYTILLEAVAHYSANSIEKFIELTENDSVKAKSKAQQIIEEERNRKAQLQERVVEAMTAEESEKRANKELTEKLSELENKLNLSNKQAQERINKLNDEFGKQNDIINKQSDELKKQGDKINEQDGQLISIKKQIKKYYIRLLIGLVSLAIFFLTFIFVDKIGNWAWLTGILSSSGWLWGLGSFFINVIRIMKGK